VANPRVLLGYQVCAKFDRVLQIVRFIYMYVTDTGSVSHAIDTAVFSTSVLVHVVIFVSTLLLTRHTIHLYHSSQIIFPYTATSEHGHGPIADQSQVRTCVCCGVLLFMICRFSRSRRIYKRQLFRCKICWMCHRPYRFLHICPYYLSLYPVLTLLSQCTFTSTNRSTSSRTCVATRTSTPSTDLLNTRTTRSTAGSVSNAVPAKPERISA